MTIEYLQKYRDNIPNIKTSIEIKPCTIQEIESLEESLNQGKPFPKVFREFLFIGGNYHGLPFDMGYTYMESETKRCIQGLRDRGLIMDRPIVVFDQLDSEQYSFIYLDEGDDPQTWNCFVVDDEESIWKAPFSTFKEEVEFAVDRAVLGLGF